MFLSNQRQKIEERSDPQWATEARLPKSAMARMPSSRPQPAQGEAECQGRTAEF